MARLLSFPKEYFIREKNRSLTPSMKKALELAYHKQRAGVLFGPKDIKGSVTPLIQRGLITSSIKKVDGEIHLTWYVTEQAIKLLEDSAQMVAC